MGGAGGNCSGEICSGVGEGGRKRKNRFLKISRAHGCHWFWDRDIRSRLGTRALQPVIGGVAYIRLRGHPGLGKIFIKCVRTQRIFKEVIKEAYSPVYDREGAPTR
ncbi:hypothetical protein Bbelb_430910 [Branchiostoma belcheri]|nr:hypothetical protein Bbelb_430910 [Branchiostoma belcheri]